MKLYFSPLACSLATRIALYEAGAADATFVEVDPRTKLTQDERRLDFRTLHPLGLVPALELDDGELLVENAAILPLVAARFPQAKLAPTDERGRARLQRWLGFVGTELHKAIFVPLLDPRAPAAMKDYVQTKVDGRLGYLDRHLAGRDFLLDDFSVADAYLFAVLNWTMVTPVDLSRYPAVAAYHQRMLARPAVARAFHDERALYAKELARHAAEARAEAIA